MTGSDKATELIESWKIVLKNEMKPNGKAWVLFKHGTVVLVGDAQSVETVTEEAKKLMEQDGPVIAGTPHGDFNVSKSVNVFVINHNLEQSYKQTTRLQKLIFASRDSAISGRCCFKMNAVRFQRIFKKKFGTLIYPYG